MTNFFGSIITLGFSKAKVANEKFYGPKQPMKVLDVNVDNIVISILVDTKKSSYYSI